MVDFVGPVTYGMAGYIGVELNLAVGKINHVLQNFIPPINI